MATRTATINADGIKEREVLYVRYELNQQTDVEGQPTGTTRLLNVDAYTSSYQNYFNTYGNYPVLYIPTYG